MQGKPQAILLVSPDMEGPMAHDFGGDGFLTAKKAMMHGKPCGSDESHEGTPMDLAEWLTSVAAIALPEGEDLELDVSKGDDGNHGPPDAAY